MYLSLLAIFDYGLFLKTEYTITEKSEVLSYDKCLLHYVWLQSVKVCKAGERKKLTYQLV